MVKYQDLITSSESEFWEYLCNKDFKRLIKLQNQGLGDGVFMEDTSSEEEDEDQQDEQLAGLQQRRGRVTGRDRGKQGDNDEENDDCDGIMEQLLVDMQRAQEEEMALQDEIRKQEELERERLEQEKQMADAKYHENQFWKTDDPFSLDDIMGDYEN